MSAKEFSFVVVKSDEHIEHTLHSIVHQSYDLSKVEVIIEDRSGFPVEKELLDRYRRLVTIKYETIEITELAEAYNAGLKKAEGEFIAFINTNVFYSSDAVLKTVAKKSKSRIVVIRTCYLDLETNTVKNYVMQPALKGEINLENSPGELALNLIGYFIGRELLNGIAFQNGYFDECKVKFILDLLIKNPVYYYDDSIKIYSLEPFEDNTSKCAIQYQPQWYFESLEHYYNEIKDQSDVPIYLQEAIMYLVFAKINCNLQDRNKGVVEKDDFNKLMDQMVKVVSLLDDEVILQLFMDNERKRFIHRFKIPRWIRMYFFNRKYDRPDVDFKELVRDRCLFYSVYKNGIRTSKVPISNLEKEMITVYAINYRNNKLYFDCSTTVRDFLNEDQIKICIKCGEKQLKVQKSDIYPLLKVFGKTISRKYRFSFEVDLTQVKAGDEISASILYKEIVISQLFNFLTVHARLCNTPHSFWHFGKYILENNTTHLKIKKATAPRLFGNEIIFDLLKFIDQSSTKQRWRVLKLAFLRMLYYITKPYYKNKHIWLAWDKLYKAGDNGEYMYQYCLKQKANVYYIVKKDSPDYPRLKKQNRRHTIVYNSLKAKLYSLHSEVILDTHANVISYCGFEGLARDFACGLFNPEVICIQHGLTIQKIAQFQNRLFDNIKLYCCASKFEVENISDPFYGYDPAQIKLTGLARYDGLKSNDQKIILITPTWRRNVVNSSVAHIKKSHNDNFKNSDYFKIYNGLINNQELINCALETGYKIIYLLHPAMSGQLEDFDQNDFVEIIPATGDINYEKILTESSLMVTDYSGVQFDFAYQRKPLVYYHPDKLPPHYDAGGLEYDTMGFGPVCKNEESIVGELCDYMRNGCSIKEEYRNRADSFFEFDDFNNCERIYQQILDYLKKKQ